MTGLHVPINIDGLQTGVTLNCRIYSNKRCDDLYFICENVKITDNMKDRLKRIVAPNNVVYIPLKYLVLLTPAQYSGPIPEPDFEPPVVKETWSPDEPAENELAKKIIDLEEVKLQYRTAKFKTSKLFDDVAARDCIINEAEAEDISKMIQLQLESADSSLIMQSINSIRNVDEYLYTHSLNVALINGLMAKWLKYNKTQQDELVKIGLLHDIGKLKIPPEILNKPAKLTKEEFDIIKKHPFFSFEMILQSGNKNEAILKGIVQHHEKVNGRGYPCGIGVNEITEYAKITAISDIYDAMVAKRVYKDAHSPFEILDSFSKGSYSELDIKYVKLFINCMIEELKGKMVLLSDGRTARIMYINREALKYPIVVSGSDVIETSPLIYTVSLVSESSL